MFMPLAGGYRYIVQASCSLTAWPEWCALRVETGHTIGAFIFEEILCRWGAVEEIVTSGKHHLSFCTFSHLNNFFLRCNKIKDFMTAFSVLFLLISCRIFSNKILCFI